MDERGAAVVISPHPKRREPREIDRDLYTWCHLVEKFFARLKEFKRIAMRADKTDQNFTALIYLRAPSSTHVESRQALDVSGPDRNTNAGINLRLQPASVSRRGV
ncbi:transposase [Methylobacterium soli]|uniref:Transposase n=1 Tax=Methylobacterium soli TaxID=553447 RepID=A0A6L3T6N4_9HYPH|nr:transposase [Methylobacterium soli]KAB1080856.1 transposase [Methylobacterium soli]